MFMEDPLKLARYIRALQDCSIFCVLSTPFTGPTCEEPGTLENKMSTIAAFIMATFTTPENIGVTPQSMLWLLPLVATISVVYKTTKLPKIRFTNFVKESVVLFGSIVVFMAITALVLVAFAWLVTE